MLEARSLVERARDVPIAGAAARELVAALCDTIDDLSRALDTQPVDDLACNHWTGSP